VRECVCVCVCMCVGRADHPATRAETIVDEDCVQGLYIVRALTAHLQGLRWELQLVKLGVISKACAGSDTAHPTN